MVKSPESTGNLTATSEKQVVTVEDTDASRKLQDRAEELEGLSSLEIAKGAIEDIELLK